MGNYNAVDLVGHKYGRLTVLSFHGVGKHHKHLWNCLCDCGTEKVMSSSALRIDNTKSCGCLNLESVSKEPGTSAKNKLFYTYKSGASKRKLDFLLSFEYFIQLTSMNCHYCQSSPTNTVKSGRNWKSNQNYLYNGIDRVDNTKGYIIENCVPCCQICNRAKSTMSHKDFISWARNLHEGLTVRDIRKALGENSPAYVSSQIGITV